MRNMQKKVICIRSKTWMINVVVVSEATPKTIATTQPSPIDAATAAAWTTISIAVQTCRTLPHTAAHYRTLPSKYFYDIPTMIINQSYRTWTHLSSPYCPTKVKGVVWV